MHCEVSNTNNSLPGYKKYSSFRRIKNACRLLIPCPNLCKTGRWSKAHLLGTLLGGGELGISSIVFFQEEGLGWLVEGLALCLPVWTGTLWPMWCDPRPITGSNKLSRTSSSRCWSASRFASFSFNAAALSLCRFLTRFYTEGTAKSDCQLTYRRTSCSGWESVSMLVWREHNQPIHWFSNECHVTQMGGQSMSRQM